MLITLSKRQILNGKCLKQNVLFKNTWLIRNKKDQLYTA